MLGVPSRLPIPVPFQWLVVSRAFYRVLLPLTTLGSRLFVSRGCLLLFSQ